MSVQVKRFSVGTRFRVIIGQASFYATARQIRNGVGDLAQCNAAVQKALDSLEGQRSYGGILACSVGLAGTWEGLNVQLNLVR